MHSEKVSQLLKTLVAQPNWWVIKFLKRLQRGLSATDIPTKGYLERNYQKEENNMAKKKEVVVEEVVEQKLITLPIDESSKFELLMLLSELQRLGIRSISDLENKVATTN